MENIVSEEMTTGDAVWIATALLHREHPDVADFSTADIRQRVQTEGIARHVKPITVYLHAQTHCVADFPASPARLRMLESTAPDRRRLFKSGDTYHPDREGPQDHGGTRTTPRREALPARFASLLDWYRTHYSASSGNPADSDPILALRGHGKEVWSDEEPDAYVARMRAVWV